jgi:1-phosphofructokinase
VSLCAIRETRIIHASAGAGEISGRRTLLIEQDSVLFGEAPVAQPVSAVGAGDALLAGFLAAGGKGNAALETALRWAATAVLHPGTILSSVDERISVSVTAEPDLARPLR